MVAQTISEPGTEVDAVSIYSGVVRLRRSVSWYLSGQTLQHSVRPRQKHAPVVNQDPSHGWSKV